MSESVPSSVTGFAHRRPRADSLASFIYFQEEDESPIWSDDQAIREEEDREPGKRVEEDLDFNVGSDTTASQRRKSSGLSRTSLEDPLLIRRGSYKAGVNPDNGLRYSQKIYLRTEDLTIVVAGFTTKPLSFLLYLGFCVLSLGLGFLILRWVPRWRVHLVGSPKPLRDCDWVIIEVRSPCHRRTSRTAAKRDQNERGEFSVQNVVNVSYGHAASTVFGLGQRKGHSFEYDEDDDPLMMHLRFLNYRYVRFCFHPSIDKFVMCSDWKDPKWTNVKSIRTGLESEERHRREQVFGPNQIDIPQKSIPHLLIDEVGTTFAGGAIV